MSHSFALNVYINCFVSLLFLDHVNVHLKKFQCSMCQKSFGRERYLQTHLKTCGMAAKEIALQQQQQDLSDFEPLSSAVVGDCKEDGLDKGSTMISIIGKEPGPVDPQEDDEKYRVSSHHFLIC